MYNLRLSKKIITCTYVSIHVLNILLSHQIFVFVFGDSDDVPLEGLGHFGAKPVTHASVSIADYPAMSFVFV